MVNGNIIISSIGRRAGLLRCFRESLSARASSSLVFGIDSGASAPAAFLAAGFSRVPRCTERTFIDAVISECRQRSAGLVVPTIDTELAIYASASSRFAELDIKVCISAPETIRICCDKVSTHQWLVANGFPTVRQAAIQIVLDEPTAWAFPVIVKPIAGSASVGVRKVDTREELETIGRARPDYLVQEIASGCEYTVNVYVSREGNCVCALPHWRMETRGGEVSKGITVKDGRLIRLAREVASKLPGAYGPLNIQCFMDNTGEIKIIEMNARFGGGYPLAHRAGARFTDWLLLESEGERLSYFEAWADDLAMLRYDDAVYLPGSTVRQ